jgi:hypothetical protein
MCEQITPAFYLSDLATWQEDGNLTMIAHRSLIRYLQKLKRKRTRVSACFNGRGGTRIIRHPQLNQQLNLMIFRGPFRPRIPLNPRICQ